MALQDDVIDNPDENRFELPLEGEDIAAAYYIIDENGNVVPDPYRGALCL